MRMRGNNLFRLTLFGHKAVEAGGVCLLLMVQGNLAGLTLGHVGIASQTGLARRHPPGWGDPHPIRPAFGQPVDLVRTDRGLHVRRRRNDSRIALSGCLYRSSVDRRRRVRLFGRRLFHADWQAYRKTRRDPSAPVTDGSPWTGRRQPAFLILGSARRSRRRRHADAEHGAWLPSHQTERRVGKGTPTSGQFSRWGPAQPAEGGRREGPPVPRWFLLGGNPSVRRDPYIGMADTVRSAAGPMPAPREGGRQ